MSNNQSVEENWLIFEWLKWHNPVVSFIWITISLVFWIIWHFLLLSWFFTTIYWFIYSWNFSYIFMWVFWIWAILSYLSYEAIKFHDRFKDESWKIIWWYHFFTSLIKALFTIWLVCIYSITFIQIIQNKNLEIKEWSFNSLIWWTEVKIVQLDKDFKINDNYKSRDSYEIDLYKHYFLKIIWKFKI